MVSGFPTRRNSGFLTGDTGKNTGYGLFLTREILGITGLSIEENGEPGQGCRFEILVPHGAYRFGQAG